MKRFLSLFLSLVMAFALAAPAFAEEPGDSSDPNEGIMPLIQIFPDGLVSGVGSYRTDEFTANPGAGNYIQFWFMNQTDTPVKVYLYRTDISGFVGPVEVAPYSNERGVYHSPTGESGTYYLRIVSQDNALIVGRLAASQYTDDPMA